MRLWQRWRFLPSGFQLRQEGRASFELANKFATSQKPIVHELSIIFRSVVRRRNLNQQSDVLELRFPLQNDATRQQAADAMRYDCDLVVVLEVAGSELI